MSSGGGGGGKWVRFDSQGKAHATLHGGDANPVLALHRRTWACGVPPSHEAIMEAYLAAGFPRDQLDHAFRRKSKWEVLPEVATVRFPKAIGAILKQTELMLAV